MSVLVDIADDHRNGSPSPGSADLPATGTPPGPDTGGEAPDKREFGLPTYELSTWRASLEDAFLELTGEHADFRATTGDPQRSAS